MKKQNGVTLVALVITVIVLLILAGVAIATISGQDSVIENANKASDKWKASMEDEQANLWNYINQVEKNNAKYLQ